MQSAVVHAHFYQPPREDPWRDDVEPEPEAAPFRDWNARITHECYEPFGAARLLDADGHVTGTVNLYEWVSFDAAPTLLRWLELNAPGVYATILAADRTSAGRRRGHGNGIAAPYNHVILPLVSPRDRATEIRWGLADFRRRFGREAEGFWLPETAVDEATLVALAAEGVRFTILAPHQVENLNLSGAPLSFAAGGGHTLAVFTYDGALAADAAFGTLLRDGDELARRLAPPGTAAALYRQPLRVTSVALDGETFGHHRKFGEMALARAVSVLGAQRRVVVDNFASVLARAPQGAPIRLVEPSSWSCIHGVERWRSDCSCGAVPGASHAWRRPLRAALMWLARELDARYAGEASRLFADPWTVRDAFGAVVGGSAAERDAFLAAHVLPTGDTSRALHLLEGVRARLGMFGSCAWFFDDVMGHETVLMLRLAAYAIDVMGTEQLERDFICRLAEAPGAPEAYRGRVVPMRARAVR